MSTQLAAIHAEFRGRARPTIVEMGFWIALGLCFFIFPTKLILLTQILTSGLFAMSLDILVGYGGIACLGHAAFFGVGAYAAGLLAIAGWREPVSGLLVAALAAGVLGAIFGLLLSRLWQSATVVATLCMSLLIFEAASRMPEITGGDSGLSGIVMWPLLECFAFDFFGQTGFWYAYTVAILLYLGARRYIHSLEGLALQGLRENADRLDSLGLSSRHRKIMAFIVSGAIAGVAGGLLAQTTQIVALETLSFERSISTLIMLIVGGLGTLIGGFIGAAAFIVAKDQLSSLNPAYWMFWLGAALIVVAAIAPDGLVGRAQRLANFYRERP